jgi:hypothetical protein
MSSSFIFSAACISVAAAGMSSIFAVITSQSSMVGLLSLRVLLIQILCGFPGCSLKTGGISGARR